MLSESTEGRCRVVLFCRQEMEGRGDFGRRSVRAAPPTSAPTSVVRAGHVRGLLLLDPRHRQRKRQGVRPIGDGGGRGGRNTGGAAGMLSAFAFSIGLNLLFQSYILHIQNVSCGRRDFRLRMSFFHSPRRWTTTPLPSSPATPDWPSEGGRKSVAAMGDGGTRLHPGEWATGTATS